MTTRLTDIARCAVRASRRSLVRSCARCSPAFRVTPRPALVVAPHPDDEVFGTGGLIAAKRATGANVNVVYLTGGGNSHRDCCTVPAEQVVAHRRQLAVRAMGLLGVEESSCWFMGLPDGSLPGLGQPAFGSAVSALARILADLRPAEVYCTHPMEVWPDHVAASAVTRAAVRSALPGTAVHEYLVWAPLNRPFMDLVSLPWQRAARLTIRPWADLKAQAIRSYLSGTAACGHPWVGQLPQDFLRFFDWPCEVFFQSVSRQ